MTAHIISINVASPRTVEIGGRVRETGIYKEPVSGPVEITRDGVAGDTITDKENHGGVDQAVYVYGAPDYAWWEDQLGRELAPGTFGENLTISGLESAVANIGDRLIAGSVVLQVTAPRIPCGTFAHRMGDPAFVKRFRDAERPGLYCRVLRAGTILVGDHVVHEPFYGPTVSALKMFRDYYAPALDEATLRVYLAAPIAIRDRIQKEEQLAAYAAS